MIQQPRIDKVHLSMLEELSKKSRLKPEVYMEQIIREKYNSK